MRHKRSLRNVTLTKEFHFRYLGMWVIITVCLMLSINIVLFLWIQEHFTGLVSAVSEMHTEYLEIENVLIIGLAIESVACCVGIIALGKLTAHRIAGPYIKLERSFAAIRDGNLETRLHFRKYDHLDKVATTFNQMMDRLTQSRPDA